MRDCDSIERRSWLRRALAAVGQGTAPRIGGKAGHPRAAWIVGCVVLSFLFAAAATWPAVTGLDSLVITDLIEPDVQVGIWQPRPFVNWVLDGQSPWHPPELIWPHGQDMSRILLNYIIPVLFLPIHLFSGPLLGLNLSILATMVLNGLACAWAGWAVTGSRLGALAGLAVGSTSAYAFAEGGFGRLEQALWAPVAVYLGAFSRLRESPGSRRDILLCAAGLAAAGAVYWFYAYFLVVLTVLLVIGAVARGHLDKQSLRDLFLVGAGAFVFVLPILLPVVFNVLTGPDVFVAVWKQEKNYLIQQMRASLMLQGYLGPFGWGRNWVATRAPILLFPVCGWVAFRGPRGLRPVAWMGLLSAVFAAGPFLLGDDGQPIRVAGRAVNMPMSPLTLLPGFKRLWWPYRWMGVATPAFALTAAWAVTRLKGARLHLAWFSLGCVLECFFVLRSGLEPGRTLFREAEVPAVFAELAKNPMSTPIMQIPDSRLFNGMVGWQAFHKQPISSGLCWHMPDVVSKPNEPGRKLREVLTEAMEKGTATKRRWTLDETGGFYHVLYRKNTGREDRGPIAGLNHLLGSAFYEDRLLALWAIPGVGRPPALGTSGAMRVGDKVPMFR